MKSQLWTYTGCTFALVSLPMPAVDRRKYNNIVILLIVGMGMLLLTSNRITQPNNSVPMWPPELQIETLVYAEQMVPSTPLQISEPSPTAALLSAWQQARLLPINPPSTELGQPVQVDIYLQHQAEPYTVLIYPQHTALKLLGEPQWWRLLNQPIERLLLPPK